MITADAFYSLPPRMRTKQELSNILDEVRQEAAEFALRAARADIDQRGTAEQAVGVIDAHLSDPVPMGAYTGGDGDIVAYAVKLEAKLAEALSELADLKGYRQ